LAFLFDSLLLSVALCSTLLNGRGTRWATKNPKLGYPRPGEQNMGKNGLTNTDIRRLKGKVLAEIDQLKWPSEGEAQCLSSHSLTIS
jgi:hypothetical protein